MKKFLLLLIIFSCLNALAQGKITGLQELTDDEGTYYYHDIPIDGTQLSIVKATVQEPVKDPAVVPFLKKWSIVAKVEGEDIESVKFKLVKRSGGDAVGFSSTFIDNEPPFSAFGDENGIFETIDTDRPFYTIEATPYTEDNAQGTELQGATSSFSIISYNNEMGPTLQIIDKETNEVLVETTSEESKTVDYNLVKDKAVLLKFSKGTGIINFRVKISKDNEAIRIPAPPLSLDLLFAQYSSNLIFTSGNHTITTESNGRNRNSWLAGRRDISTSWDINFVDNSGAKTYIPDDNFEQALIDLGYDDVLDDYVATVRLEEVTDLNFYKLNITDLKGIEAMINLKNLAIEDELGTIAIDHLDLSENVNLETLAVVQSGLQSINLQNNTKLKELAILDNYLEEIDLSNNKELTELTWIGNQAETLELSELKKLTILTLLSTHVKALDLSELTELVELRIGETQLEVLDVSGLTKLVEFNAQGSNLYCIQVNDQQDTSSWVKDDTATFSTDCTISVDDTDNDGILDALDVCPNTPAGETVNSFGCSASQLADLAVQNIGLRLGSDPCSEAPSGFAEISVLKNVPLKIQILKDGAEFYNGTIDLAAPLNLSALSFGEYQLCVSNDVVLGYEQCFIVSYSSESNAVATNITIQNPGQTYTIAVAGSTSYMVTVNGVTSEFTFENTEEQQIEIPLLVGVNAIVITGTIDCVQEDGLTYIPDDNFEQALIDLGYDDVLDDYILTENIANVTELQLSSKNINDFTGLNDFTSLQTFIGTRITSFGGTSNILELDVSQLLNLIDFTCSDCSLVSLDLTNNINLENVNVAGNEINEIDISTLTKLKRFLIGGANISTLDTTNNTLLEHLDLSANELETLDLTKNSSLRILSTLGQFAGVTTCIQVTNIEDAIAQENWLVDSPDNYSLDCSQQDVDGIVEEDSDLGNRILAYPTLTNGSVTIANPKKEQIGTVSVANMNGATITLIPIFNNPREINLDISGYTQGMYIIRVAKMTGRDDYMKVILD